MITVSFYLTLSLFLQWVLNFTLISEEREPSAMISPMDFAAKKLSEGGVSTSLIESFKSNSDENFRNKIIELNVLGFLKASDYSTHFTKEAIANCRKFLKKYRSLLEFSKQIYGVPPEVIVALLWVETRLGKSMGEYSVGSALFSLLQSNHPRVLKITLKTLEDTVDDDQKETQAMKMSHIEKVRQRSEEKSAWALKELIALSKIYRRNPAQAKDLLGSFAGAFGIPQFLPSSYLQWAKSFHHQRKSPNLFHMEDAVISVANYLASNGWSNERIEDQKNAIYHYNRSTSYTKIILKIMEELKVPKQVPAVQKPHY